ncbi:ATP-dependent helicase [Clostridium malenominatum]|uniref:ATP-dependent helicase n=1 Tax=Clostridium malenominatum TaxID=1539 RepID=UPI0031DB98C0
MINNKYLSFLEEKCNLKLTEEQREVVFHTKGPIAVIAVPGAGKTATLISRIGNLIINHGVSPNRILALSFSRASAKDMNERFCKFFGNVITEKLNFSTIHSFAYRVILDYSRFTNTNYTLIESTNSPITKSKLLKDLYLKHNKDYINEDKLEELSGFISFIINKMLPSNKVKDNKELPVPNALEIYEEYVGILQNNNYIDFDLMLLKCYQILRDNKQILDYYKNKYDYIMLDEAQDTSVLQFEILRMILNKDKNICIVGDDDQSIYSWRGAEVEQLLNFKTYFGSESKILFMSKNFRSTQNLVKVANEFIKENKKRFKKNLYTSNEEGVHIQFLYPEDEFNQINYLINNIRNDKNLSEISLLYRNNISSVLIVDRLIKEGIPYYVKDSVNTFFNSWVIKDILSFCNLSINLKDINAFEKIYYKMNSYIKRDDVKKVQRFNALNKNVFQTLIAGCDSEYNKIKLLTLKEKFNTLKTLPPYDGIEFILKDLQYRTYLTEYAKKFDYSMDNINTLLNTLKSLCRELNSISEIENNLNFIKENMETSIKNKYKNAITLTTFHSAKGLEFDTCYCIDMSNDIIPTCESIIKKKDGDFSSYNEEVRLAYVGITRARKNLYILSPKNRNNKAISPSQFVHRLSKIVSSFTPSSHTEKVYNNITDTLEKDSRVSHKSFGNGKITSKTGDFITVFFDNGLEKTFSAKVCIVNNLMKVI